MDMQSVPLVVRDKYGQSDFNTPLLENSTPAPNPKNPNYLLKINKFRNKILGV